jgi:hypothetical protein
MHRRTRKVQFPKLRRGLRRQGPTHTHARTTRRTRAAQIKERTPFLGGDNPLLLIRGPPDLHLETPDGLVDGELVLDWFLPVRVKKELTVSEERVDPRESSIDVGSMRESAPVVLLEVLPPELLAQHVVWLVFRAASYTSTTELGFFREELTAR